MAVLCAFFLSFTLKSRQISDEAKEYAQGKTEDVVQQDSLKRAYLDSLWNVDVYSLLGLDEYTYREVKKYEISLGLDLQGGMHVVMEVTPDELIKALSGKRVDPRLENALKLARERSTASQDKFTDLFYAAFKEQNPNTNLSQLFANANNADRISASSTDEEVLRVLNKEVDLAVDRVFTIIRSRIDRFGVTQPNIQKLEGTNRIQVELAGVDNPKRVRKILSTAAKLEFLEKHTPQTIGEGLMAYNEFLYKQEQLTKDDGKEGLEELSGETDEAADVPNLEGLSGDDDAVMDAAGDVADTVVEEANDLVEGLVDTAKKEEGSLEELLDGDGAEQSPIADSLGGDSTNQFKRSRLFEILSIDQNANEFGGVYMDLIVAGKNKNEVLRLLSVENIKGFFPKYTEFLPEYKPMTDRDGKVILGDNGEEFYRIHAVKRLVGGAAPVDGDAVIQASSYMNPKSGYEINLKMNPSGSKDWARLTKKLGANPKRDPRMVAIVLDKQVYSAPRVLGEIPNGSTQITGNFTKEDAEDLANILKAGSLPATPRIVEEAVVGPTIGEASVKAGLRSIIGGLCLVLIFMILYYNKGGIVADVALFVNIFFIVGLLAQFDTSLTLPGIAGIVLTIGMSIDSNVLIFERIKEELALGKVPLKAIENGYSKALLTILDSNITTLIVGVILAYFGSGPVKGFAFTLMIGILCSFFTSVFVSRLIVHWLTRKNEGRNMSFDTFVSKGLFKTVNFNFIGKRKMAYIFSGIIIAIGIGSIVAKGGLNLGVDFQGGRSYVVEFKNATEVDAGEVKAAMAEVFVESGTEVKSFGEANMLKITTSYLIGEESDEADDQVRATLDKGLSKFAELQPEVVGSSKVGPTIADDIKSTSFQAMLIAIVLIFIYIVIRFRKWQFGMGAIIALVHDVLIVVSLFGIARLLGIAYEVDQIFIAAVLTIIGYSINDTVVVFDRVREYLTEKPSADTADTFNKSINSTLSRTLMTSLTTLLVVIILFIFGGEALKGFSFALLIGVLFGTYSSIFIATPVVLDTAMRGGKKKAPESKS